MDSFDYSSYLSPFTWRYGTPEMRKIWSEIYKRKLWRKIWVALARAQQKENLVSKTELDDLRKHQEDIDIKKAHEIEKEIRHDLMAEIKTFAHQAKVGGGKIHLGATSMDIEDNADAVRIKESLTILEDRLKTLLKVFSKKIGQYKDILCIGYTHLQPAEPTTLGYRFAFYAQDLLLDLKLLNFVRPQLKGKGMKGAVGTSASFTLLLDRNKETLFSRKLENRVARVEKMEKAVMDELDIDAVTVASQTGPRKLEYFIAVLLSSIAQSLHKFAFDVRIMQSPGFGEWQEPFGKRQVGSSAMPFKKNPVKAEQICSLARLVFALSAVARDNAANMLLERTLDDSANRRVFLPEMFLAIDDMLQSSVKIIDGLIINQKQIEINLITYGPFAGTESVLMEAVKNGANRQAMHETLRELSMKAWEKIQQGKTNPLTKFLISDKRIIQFVPAGQVEKLLDPKTHIGLAPQYCEKLVKEMP